MSEFLGENLTLLLWPMGVGTSFIAKRHADRKDYGSALRDSLIAIGLMVGAFS